MDVVVSRLSAHTRDTLHSGAKQNEVLLFCLPGPGEGCTTRILSCRVM